MKNFFRKIKKGFVSAADKIGGYFSNRFGGLGTLVMIQLKDKLNMSFKADKKGALTKIMLKVILFIIVTVVIFVVFTLLDKLIIFGSTTKSFPFPLFSFIFSAMIILSIITCIASLTKSLYFSRDNLTLLSYPVKSDVVFLSKLIVYYILSLLREATFILPMFLAYGLAYKFSILYFIWLIPMFAIICMVPVAIASIVSIPWMYISMYLRKNPLIQDIVTLLLLIAGAGFLFFVIDKIPSNLHFLVRWTDYYYPMVLKFAQNCQHYLLPLFMLVAMTTGGGFETINVNSLKTFNATGLGYFGMVFGAIVVLILIAYFAAKPLFFTMAAKPFEFNKHVIAHDYRETRAHIKGTCENVAFVPEEIISKNLSSLERSKLISKFREALNFMNRDEKIFDKDNNKILKLLKAYTKMKFVEIDLDDFMHRNALGFVIKNEYEIKSLVLIKSVGVSEAYCYDPNHLSKGNRKKPAFFSLMWKDILMSIRTPGTLIAGFTAIIIGPLSVALMNKLFQSINTSYIGDQLVIMFNVLIITMIPLVTNVEIASIYSREGESAYLLKASPSNYTKTLTSKLVLRWTMMTISLVLTTITFGHYCNVLFNRPWLIFAAVLMLYTGHLIWSAELDYMNPQDQLYKEVGEGNISNPNEATSGAIGLIITFVFTFACYFLMKESTAKVFGKLVLIAALFFIARLVLALLKIKGYRTSRGERGRD